MIQGTTPKHTFKVSLDTSLIKSLRITYAQDGETVLTKNKDDCSLDGNSISLKLTQEETLRFSHPKMVELQLHVLTVSGDAFATKIRKISCDELLSGEVLT